MLGGVRRLQALWHGQRCQEGHGSIMVALNFKSSKIHIFLSCQYVMQASFVSTCGMW